MNIRDLKYLIALADHNHFGKAADACFVSQPALSMQIKKLEEELGVKLLERTNKSVLLTDSGISIVEKARQVLHHVNDMREIAASAKDPYSGELKMGIFPTLAPYLLPHIIPQLSKMFPKLSLYLVEEPTALLVEKLKQGKLHAAFLASPVSEINFKNAPLFEEEFLLAVPNAHSLSKRKIIKQEELSNKELLLLDEGHCLREQALSVCQMVNASENQSFRATGLETLRYMVASGVGITLIPKLACSPGNNISYIPFASPKPTRSIALFWRASSVKQIVLQEIANVVKKILAKQKMVKVVD